MFRTALRNVLAHKARLLMTVLAVMLGVAFVSGTLVFTNTVSDAYTRSSEKSFDRFDVQLRPTGTGDAAGTGRVLDRKLLDRAGKLPGAASATGTVTGFAALAGKDGEMVGNGWTTAGADHPGAGAPPMSKGRAPAAAGEIALDARTAERTGYGVGDTVRLSVSGPVLTQKVTGVFTTDDGNVAAGGTLTLFDTATAQKLFAKPGHYSRIDLATAPGTTPEQLREQAAKGLPYGVEAVTAAELAAQQAAWNASNFTTLSQVLLACAGIALFVGVFLIVNTFTMLVAQRTKELALLRAVGATRRQVTRSVLVEAFLVGLVASAAGLAFGVGAGAGVRALLSASGSTLPEGPLAVGSTAVLASLAIGVGVTLLAAWLPARHAAKIPPVAAMGSVHTPATGRSLAVRNTVGAVLAAAGGGLVIAATAVRSGNLMLGAGAALLLTGVFVLTPLLSRPVIAAAGPLLRRFGVCGHLAGQNAVRNPRRTAATASALTIGLALVAGLTVIGASADKATRELAASDYLRGDYIVGMANAGPLAPDTERKVRELDEVAASSPRRVTTARVDGVDQQVTGFRAGEIGELVGLDFAEGSFGTGGASAVVDKETAEASGWRVGDILPVTWPDGARGELRLTGVYESTFDDGVKTDLSAMEPHLDRVFDTEVFVKTSGGPSEEVKRTLEKALGDSPAIRISDKQDLVDNITGTVGVVLNILYGMLALAVVVAVLGVVNTLAMSVHERAQEIGLLRAIGLDRSGVRRMVRLESVVISLFGGVLGVGLGVFFGWAVGELVAAMEINTWQLVVPWGRLALFLAAAALVGVIAALWPARRAAKLDVLTAIKAE
ncbi:FtsX-like permease family protein [Streptomyces pathocidini]|uniref:ABC transporter permease n=1 Tax=Streptomyces pathocidini TaxID=1650571 RepID=UPI00340BA9A9